MTGQADGVHESLPSRRPSGAPAPFGRRSAALRLLLGGVRRVRPPLGGVRRVRPAMSFLRGIASSARTKKAHYGHLHSAPCFLAERKGLEPSASGVTGRRYNRLNYRSGWWAVQDLNLWPPPCKGASLMRVLLYSKAGLLSTVFIHHHFLTHGMAHRSIQIFSTLLTFLVHNEKPVLRWKQRWITSCPSAQAARTARRTCSCSPSGSTAKKTREDLRLCRKTRRKEMADRPWVVPSNQKVCYNFFIYNMVCRSELLLQKVPELIAKKPVR